jgi:hypothetical protein
LEYKKGVQIVKRRVIVRGRKFMESIRYTYDPRESSGKKVGVMIRTAPPGGFAPMILFRKSKREMVKALLNRVPTWKVGTQR